MRIASNRDLAAACRGIVRKMNIPSSPQEETDTCQHQMGDEAANKTAMEIAVEARPVCELAINRFCDSQFHFLALENAMDNSRRILLGTALAVGISCFSLPNVVFAQKDAGAKARGESTVPFWDSRYSSRRIHHARDYARDFHGYIVENPKPDPAVVKEVTTEIGRNIEEAKKHLATMKKNFASDKEAVVAIEKLEKELEVAFDHHKLLCDCCAQTTFDAEKTMECCNDVAKQLDKFIADHDELMRKLSRKPAATAPAK
jgi:hypothetical protein